MNERMNMLVRGRHVITDPAVGASGVLDDAAVLVAGSRIASVGAGPCSAGDIPGRGWWATASSC
jgi:hypothetical protein